MKRVVVTSTPAAQHCPQGADEWQVPSHSRTLEWNRTNFELAGRRQNGHTTAAAGAAFPHSAGYFLNRPEATDVNDFSDSREIEPAAHRQGAPGHRAAICLTRRRSRRSVLRSKLSYIEAATHHGIKKISPAIVIASQ